VHNEELHAGLLLTKYSSGDQIKADEPDGASGTYGADEKFMFGLRGKT
jgi:hypothetical protein